MLRPHLVGIDPTAISATVALMDTLVIGHTCARTERHFVKTAFMTSAPFIQLRCARTAGIRPSGRTSRTKMTPDSTMASR